MGGSPSYTPLAQNPEPSTFAEFERLLEQELGLAAAQQAAASSSDEDSSEEDDREGKSEDSVTANDEDSELEPERPSPSPEGTPKPIAKIPLSTKVGMSSYTRSHPSADFAPSRSPTKTALSDSLASDDDTAVESDADHQARPPPRQKEKVVKGQGQGQGQGRTTRMTFIPLQ